MLLYNVTGNFIYLHLFKFTVTYIRVKFEFVFNYMEYDSRDVPHSSLLLRIVIYNDIPQ